MKLENLIYFDELDTGETGGGGGAAPADATWQSALPEDIRENASLANLSSVEALAKSYINTKSMVGKDTFALPQSDEQWADIYNKLGRPGAGAEYVFESPKDFAETDLRSEESDGALRDAMHGLGMNQSQAAGMSDFMYSIIQGQNDTTIRDSETAHFNATQELTREYGPALAQKVAAGRQVVKEFGGDEALKILTDHNYGNEPSIVKMFAKLSESVLGDSALISGEGGITPDDLKSQIGELMGKPGYTDGQAPDHTMLVTKVMALRDRLHSAAI